MRFDRPIARAIGSASWAPENPQSARGPESLVAPSGNKWGTANPIMMRDNDLGIVRARAFGTYDFKIVDPKLFLKEVAGSDSNFRLDEFTDTMRSRIVSVF